MNEVSTQDPIVAVDTLLDQALPEAPLLSEEQILSEHQSLRRAWASQQLFAGTPAEIKAIILPNLQELAAIPQFEQFVVRVLPNLSCAQVIAIFSTDTFTGVRVWRGASRVYTCGNSAFHG
jgi:hypothetical protein